MIYYSSVVDSGCKQRRICGGIAQLARVLGSYPIGRRFESHCRYQFSNTPTYLRCYIKGLTPLIYGPVVKRLRHRPFTAVTRVRFSSGSPQSTCRNTSAFFFVLKNGQTENRTQYKIPRTIKFEGFILFNLSYYMKTFKNKF